MEWRGGGSVRGGIAIETHVYIQIVGSKQK